MVISTLIVVLSYYKYSYPNNDRNYYVTWSFKYSVKVRDQLQDVQKVVGTAGAFAAIRADGRVIPG